MSDIPYIQQAQEVKITGQDSTGTTVNYVNADSVGNMLVKNTLASPTASSLTHSVVSFLSSGDNVVVAAITGQTIRIFKIYLVLSGATSITMKDGAGINLSGAMSMLANGAFILDFDSEPWHVTSTGNAFIINSTNAVQISGTVIYTQS